MRRYVAVRLLHAVVVLFIVATIAFFLIHLAPGDPFSFEHPSISPELRAEWRSRFGYDRPVFEQYLLYLRNVARGDFGVSHSLRIPVSQALGAAIPRTLLLMGIALVVSFALGIALGVYQTRHAATARGKTSSALTLFVYSLPDFWLALMLLLVFAYWIPVLPAGGMIDVVTHDYMSGPRALWDRVRHLVLPATTLVLLIAAYVSRFQRAALQEVLPAEFIRVARAKGLDEHQVVRRHALRNALLPMITLAGLAFPALLGGAVFVERVYSWPGMGMLVVNAISTRDYPLVMGAVIVGSIMVSLGSLLADVAYGAADPRIRVR